MTHLSRIADAYAALEKLSTYIGEVADLEGKAYDKAYDQYPERPIAITVKTMGAPESERQLLDRETIERFAQGYEVIAGKKRGDEYRADKLGLLEKYEAERTRLEDETGYTELNAKWETLMDYRGQLVTAILREPTSSLEDVKIKLLAMTRFTTGKPERQASQQIIESIAA